MRVALGEAAVIAATKAALADAGGFACLHWRGSSHVWIVPVTVAWGILLCTFMKSCAASCLAMPSSLLALVCT